MSDFHLHEVMGRGSETQPQVGENCNYLILALGLKLNDGALLLRDAKVNNSNCPFLSEQLLLFVCAHQRTVALFFCSFFVELPVGIP